MEGPIRPVERPTGFGIRLQERIDELRRQPRGQLGTDVELPAEHGNVGEEHRHGMEGRGIVVKLLSEIGQEVPKS